MEDRKVILIADSGWKDSMTCNINPLAKYMIDKNVKCETEFAALPKVGVKTIKVETTLAYLTAKGYLDDLKFEQKQ